MPGLRRLNGKEIITILQQFGFEVVRVRGSHHTLRRFAEHNAQNITIPVHGSKPLSIGTLRSIYRQAKGYIPEEQLRQHFYRDS